MEAEKEEKEKPTNPTSAQICKPMEYEMKKSEQQRTIEKKKEFLEVYSKTMGIVTLACQEIGINRATFYDWKDKDPDFRKDIAKVQRMQLSEVEDRLLRAILRDEGWAISLYLNRVHPKYRPKTDVNLLPTERTLEDLIDDYKTDGTITGQQGPDRKAIQDPQQERPAGAADIQSGSVLLLAAPNQTEQRPESETKGTE